ncbi:MAG: hypothetical protein M3N32_01180 [Actinomycetota bacterium]|nr:hypothetical protein [Actinomycetota bacterium]
MTSPIGISVSSAARALAALLVATLLLGACGREEDRPEAGATSETPATSVFAEPKDFVGRDVDVRGRVDSVVSPRMFNLQDLEPSGDRVQVFTKGDPPIDEGQVVRVEGTVREFDLAAFEQELGVELEDRLYDAFIGTAVILARSIEILEERAADEPTPEAGVVGVSPTGKR